MIKNVIGLPVSTNTIERIALEVCNDLEAAEQAGWHDVLTGESNHDHPITPNRLTQDFATKIINEVWLTNITYIPTKDGFTYLVAFVDLNSRKVIGCETRRTIDSQLVVTALRDAVTFRSPSPGAIVHSARGSQGVLSVSNCKSIS